MTEALVVGVVPGVTPDRWVRSWRERMPRVPVRIDTITDAEVGSALLGGADFVFARLPVAGVGPGDVHVIPLWEEMPVVVAAKDHPVKVFESVTSADLADEEVREGWDDATLDLVAAGHGIARMPQSVLRATGRRDLVGRPITDAEPTRVGLVWRRSSDGPLIEEFIGIVRGRTANSSRGAAPPAAPAAAAAAAAAAKNAKKPARPGASSGRRGGRTTGRRR